MDITRVSKEEEQQNHTDLHVRQKEKRVSKHQKEKRVNVTDSIFLNYNSNTSSRRIKEQDGYNFLSNCSEKYVYR